MDQPATFQPDTSKQALFCGAAITHYGEPYTSLPDKIQSLAFAEETCPTTGRTHYQTWAYAKVAMKLTCHGLSRAVRVAPSESRSLSRSVALSIIRGFIVAVGAPSRHRLSRAIVPSSQLSCHPSRVVALRRAVRVALSKSALQGLQTRTRATGPAAHGRPKHENP